MANLLKSYFWWSYERGSLHYDVMVTAILLFLFVSPRFIDFKDRPVETVALRSTEVLVKSAGQVGHSAQFIYQIRVDLPGGPKPTQTEDERRASALRVIEPIAGAVTLEHADPVYDAQKKIVAYDAWVLR
ncbi:MAG TPA: hypothetical protein VN612_12640 [Acidobacteriaceae bacterium]|nr:hypothetical protein [Acidobacteriaceae bacterium]